MSAGGPHMGHDDAPMEGPPSARARAGLADDLRREIADARARFEEAGLRAETHRLLGDDAGAADVVREQEAILAEVQDRLGRAVSAAVVQRDAEQVLADLAIPASGDRGGVTGPPPAAEPLAPSRPRSPVLAGVASMVAVVGVALAGVLGLLGGLDPVTVDEVSADAVPRVGVDDGAVQPAPPPSTGSGADRSGNDARSTLAPTDAPTTPLRPAPTTRPTTPVTDAAGAPPTPAPAPGLDTVVRDLIDAVAGLGAPGPADPPTEIDSSVSPLEELVEQLAPDPDPAPTPDRTDDGFVPAPSAQ